MKIGILGATGAVGLQMLASLHEQNIETEEIRLLASRRSEGRVISYQDKEFIVHEVKEDSFAGLDVVLGAVSADLARKWAPFIREAGALFIDNSSAFRLEEDVPLVIPEINGEDAKSAPRGIIANPNCSTIVALMAVAPIHALSPIKRMVASTYQAVSGAGLGGMRELTAEVNALMKNEHVEPSVFPAQIAYNCIPWIGSASVYGYTTEEMKMQNEGQKILHAPDLRVSCTCVRVPVYRSHCVSVSLECRDELSVEQAEAALSSASGVVYMKDGYPMPIDTADQDLVYVGRLRRDLVFEKGLSLFCSGDQVRKGAASNAVGILKCIL